mgnify:CR=1 FL=1
MDELLVEFIAETQETLEALASVVVAWEADPGDRDRLDAVFRFFHTVKGSCGFLSLPRFERLSHAAEDVLSQIREGEGTPDGATTTAVLAVMDRIAEMCTALSLGESLPDTDDDILIEALRACHQANQMASESMALDTENATSDNSAEARGARTQGGGPRTIRLPLSLIDQLMNGVSDIVLARNELSRKLREREVDTDLDMAFDRLSTCIADMRDSISKTRMQRVERLFMAIPRMVRDLGRDLGKKIELTLEGGDVEMDREMVEMVVDPLTHIVRNSIDHGIETPDERRAAGKSETGRLALAARQSGSQIVIEIADDGRGINVDAVVRKVVSAGIMTAQEAAALGEQERLELIFTPGLSTAQEVTAVSGRGVGMDVVRANIERLGGIIGLANEPGRGLTITLRVPLTLTIIPGLILNAGGRQFAIPRSAVIEILHDNNAMLQMSHLGGATVVTIRGTRYSMVDFEDVIRLEKQEQHGPRTVLIVRSASGVPYALGVASVENHEELVIRPAAPMVMAAGVYAGMTLPDSGQPMLLLDAGGIAQVAQLPLDADKVSDSRAAVADDEQTRITYSALEFRELDGRERVIRLSLVDRVEDIDLANFDQTGGRSYVRVDGRLLPSFHPVSPATVTDQNYVTCLRLRDGQREICYPVQAIVDIFEIPEELDMILPHGHVAGLALVNARQVEVIDSFALFAMVADDAPAELRPLRCLIDESADSWNRDILAPLLRQAGYEVAIWNSDQSVDDGRTVLLTNEAGAPDPDVKMPVVRLRANSQPQDAGDDSIFRYDREGLMQAIAAAAGQDRRSA